MTKLTALAAIFSVMLALPLNARANSLIADLSDHLVAITTAFSGDDVLLYGALGEEGRDIAVVVKGPIEPVTIRRKSRVGPIWLNTDSLTFEDVPRYYAVAASVPLSELADAATLERHSIGLDYLTLTAQQSLPAAELQDYRNALIRNMQNASLYTPAPSSISFLGGRLFRTNLTFPANVPPGSFNVEILEFENGQVTSAQRNVLLVSKVGAEAELFDLARSQPALYGLISILIAIGAGWTASALFKRS